MTTIPHSLAAVMEAAGSLTTGNSGTDERWLVPVQRPRITPPGIDGVSFGESRNTWRVNFFESNGKTIVQPVGDFNISQSTIILVTNAANTIESLP